MKQRSISGWMLVVAWAAANVAAGRALFELFLAMLYGAAVPGVAAQVALRRAWKKADGRAFWLGFALGVVVGLASFVWHFAPEIFIARSPSGVLGSVPYANSLFWSSFEEAIEPWVASLQMKTGPFDLRTPLGHASYALVVALFASTPVLGAGVACGGLARLACGGGRWFERRKVAVVLG